jgi:hypothetical protein
MRAAWRCAPIERRLRPAAQPAARTVWPPIGSTDAGPVARPAPWREARTQWPHVVPTGVVHAPLHWVVPNCPRSARGARLGRDHAAPSRPCFTRVHQSAPRFHSRRLAHRGPRCGAKSAVPGAGPAVPSASVGGPTPPGGPRFAAPPPPSLLWCASLHRGCNGWRLPAASRRHPRWPGFRRWVALKALALALAVVPVVTAEAAVGLPCPAQAVCPSRGALMTQRCGHSALMAPLLVC